MSKQVLTPLLLLLTLHVYSQDQPTILQRCLGGSSWEGLGSKVRAQRTSDGGYIIVSNTKSEDGDVSGLHTDGSADPPNDIWVVKLSKYGGIQWQKCLGGTRNDYCAAIDTGANNTYFIAGRVYSNDGDVSGHHNDRAPDGWIVKLNSSGQIIWQKCIGGYEDDDINGIRSTRDGGCIVVGITRSNDGDVSGNHNPGPPPNNLHDAWVVKLNGSGAVSWSKCYGSSKRDNFYDVWPTADGNYIVVGSTNGNDGDVSGNHPGFNIEISDGWVLKLNSSGNVIWKNCYGGDGNDGLYAVRPTSDGGYIFSGGAASVRGEQVPGFHLSQSGDAWLLKTDAAGNFIWGRCYGGVWGESAASIIVQNDGYLFAGGCERTDGDVQGSSYQLLNVWTAKVSLNGDLLWQKVAGGNGTEHFGSLMLSEEGYPAIVAITNSRDGDIKGFHQPSIPGNDVNDIWFARFGPYNTVNLLGFADFNSNNVKDNGEPFFPVYRAELYRNNTLADTYFADGDSVQVFADTGAYSIIIKNYNNYYLPVPATVNATFTNYFNTIRQNIAFKPAGDFKDLNLQIVNVTGNRRGGAVNVYRIHYENTGTATVISPFIEFIKDSRTTYQQASVQPSVIVQDTLRFNFPQLTPFTKGYIDVTLRNATSLLLDDTTVTQATIFPVSTDFTPDDNHSLTKELIIGSYDPNDKIENHGGSFTRTQVLSGEYLHYTIRFQNTGNDTAFFISIKDTLAAQYDPASLELTASSHAYAFNRKGNVCNWHFSDIKLVDSHRNEPASHGYVCFRIKLKNNTGGGDTVRNKAAIYFDYNPPVITGQHKTAIKGAAVTSVGSPDPASFIRLFPNPVTDGKFTVQCTEALPGDIFIEIYDEAGARLITVPVGKSLNGFTKEINMRKWPNGRYFIVISSGGGKHAKLLTKLH